MLSINTKSLNERMRREYECGKHGKIPVMTERYTQQKWVLFSRRNEKKSRKKNISLRMVNMLMLMCQFGKPVARISSNMFFF